MSRTQQKLQAMSAQEMLIQEKKRMIEEKMRLENAKKQHLDTNGNNAFKNDGSFLQQFQKTQGQLTTQTHEYQPPPLPPPPWLPPPFPFNQAPFLPPPPPLPFLPSPDLLSKMFQTPPPPLPVPAPDSKPASITPKINIKTEDLYDPLQAEEEDDDANLLLNIKKEPTTNSNRKSSICTHVNFVFFSSFPYFILNKTND